MSFALKLGRSEPFNYIRWFSRPQLTISASMLTMSLRTRLKSRSNMAFCCLKDCLPSYFHFAILTPEDSVRKIQCECEGEPFRNMQHPREQLNEIRSWSGRHGRAGAESVDLLDSFIVFGFEGGVIIQDRHSRRGGRPLEVFL